METLFSGLAIGECPRWHNGRLWLSNWGAQEVLAIDLNGQAEVMARVSNVLTFSIDWLPDDGLLVVQPTESRLLRQELDGSLVVREDLAPLSDRPWNEIVVDGRGRGRVHQHLHPPGTVAQIDEDQTAVVADRVYLERDRLADVRAAHFAAHHAASHVRSAG